MMLWTVSASAQSKVHHVVVDKNATAVEHYAAEQLREFLYKGELNTDTMAQKEGTVYIGDTKYLRKHFATYVDSLRDDGYLICGDGRNLCLYGAGEKGTLYAVYAWLEKIGYRLYTPSSMAIPDIYGLKVPVCHEVSNPAFAYREVSYYYPNHSRLYADWHHLHTQADRNREWGMFVHTFQRLLPPGRYFNDHPEWFSLNNGRRSHDGQLCLSNPEVLEMVCERLSDTIESAPQKQIWSVSPNDNYNACECDNCKRMDSVYGGQSGTLLWFVNRVAQRFPDKTIATLAYQYTRKAPTSDIRPEDNVLIMLCPIEAGHQAPIYQTDPSFRKDMEDWTFEVTEAAGALGIPRILGAADLAAVEDDREKREADERFKTFNFPQWGATYTDLEKHLRAQGITSNRKIGRLFDVAKEAGIIVKNEKKKYRYNGLNKEIPDDYTPDLPFQGKDKDKAPF